MKIKFSVFAFMLMVSSGATLADDPAFEQKSVGALRDIFCQTQYTILGDTDHSDAAIVAFIAQDAVLDAMHECGVSAIYAERAPEMQINFDKVAADTMGLDEFIKKLENAGYGERGKAVLNADFNLAKKSNEDGRNIKFYAVQKSTGASDITEIVFYLKMSRDIMKQMLPEDMQEEYDYFHTLTPERKNEIAEVLFNHEDIEENFAASQKLDAMAAEVRARMEGAGIKREDDYLLYEDVTDRPAAEERVVILIGNGHPREPDIGIYDRLGHDEAAWVEIRGVMPRSEVEYSRATPDLILDLRNEELSFAPN